ncbi:MAG: hypothetical protein RLZZ15_4444 [Verrucomicrobiota bacterium]
MVPDSEYRIKLQVFEGPLDLLLFLIRKNELDIYDIPIESVTRQYIDALHAMQRLDLEVAGEFFVMAAALMEIKSRMLLPRGLAAIDPNAEDEGLDPRWELVHQLLQYKKFKEAAAKLNELSVIRQNLMERFISDLSLGDGERPLKGVDRIELWNSFNMVLRRLAEKLVVGEIHDEQTTVSDQMEWLLKRTLTEKTFIFSHLFPEGVTLRRLVATFLAMLELTRLKKLRVRQHEAFADIIIEAVMPDDPVLPILDSTPPTVIDALPIAETPAVAIDPVSPPAKLPVPVVEQPAPIVETPAPAAETEIPLETKPPENTVTA